MSPITNSSFGTISSGESVDEYILSNDNGSRISVITYGATLRSWHVKDATGKDRDIVLGYDHLKGWV